MPAGVISPDVAGEITGAFCPCTFLFWRMEHLTDRLFIVAELHAAAAVRAPCREFITFCTGFDRHPVGSGDADNFFPQSETLLRRDLCRFGKISFDFGVKVNEADYNRFGCAVQHRSHLLECTDMVFRRIPVGEENRVIAPADGIHTDPSGEDSEVV